MHEIVAFEFTPGFRGVRVTRSLVLCVMLYRSLFVLFLLSIVLSALQFTDSDFSFGIFKLFALHEMFDVILYSHVL